MEVRIRKNWVESGIRELSFQEGFPEHVQCNRCHSDSIPMAILSDTEGLIARERPSSLIIWPHDSCTFVLYICTKCGEVDVEWDQA